MNLGNFSISKKRFFFLIAILILVISLPIFLFISSRNDLTNLRSNASLDGTEQATEKIITSESQSDILNSAQDRKDKMDKLAEENPEQFLLNAVDKDAKNTLPAASENLIEEEVNLTGYINLLDTESEKANYVFVQVNQNDEILNSYVLKLTPELKEDITPDTKVNLKGYILNGKLIPYEISTGSVLQAQDTNTGKHSLAIIPVNFSDKSNQEYTKQELNNRFFTDSDSVTNYFKDVSNGKININGKIFDPVKVNMRAADICKRPDALNYLLRYVTEEADKKMAQRGDNLSGYEHRAYIFPRLGPTPKTDEPCTFVAQATIGNQIAPNRNFSRMIVNGHYFKSNPSWRTSALTHEMGHNLGLGHASTLRCGRESVNLYGKCEDDEYGDQFDLMGFQYYYYPQIGAVNKDKLGLLSDTNKIAINSGKRTVDLYTTSKNTTNPQLIRIPRKNIGDNMYIDYRQPVGFDKKLPSSVTNGAMIKIANTNKINTRNNIYKTFLLNNSPGQNNSGSSIASGYFGKSALRDGQEFFDQINNIRIRQLSHDKDKVTLEINVGEPPCVRQNPNITLSPLNKSGRPGQAKSYTVTIKNKDLERCGNTTYNLSLTTPNSNWTTSFSKQSLTIAPQKTASTTFTIKSPNTATNGQKKMQLKVSARNGQLSRSKDLKYTVVNGAKPPTGGATKTKTPTPTKKPTNTPTPTKKPNQTSTPTPTRLPTSTPIPTAPVEEGKTYLDVNLGLQGIGNTGDNSQPSGNFGNKNPVKKQAKVNIKIYGPNNVLAQELNEDLMYNSATGKYTSTIRLKDDFKTDFYNVFISSPSYLLGQTDINIENGKVNILPSINLSGGDINMDKVRNLLDWNLLLACSIFNSRNETLCPNNSDFKTNSDLNSNGVVNQDDINLWLREFFQGRRL